MKINHFSKILLLITLIISCIGTTFASIEDPIAPELQNLLNGGSTQISKTSDGTVIRTVVIP